MTYVLNKTLKMKKKDDPDLYGPGHPCIHKCTKDCTKKPCKECKKQNKNVQNAPRINLMNC